MLFFFGKVKSSQDFTKVYSFASRLTHANPQIVSGAVWDPPVGAGWLKVCLPRRFTLQSQPTIDGKSYLSFFPFLQIFRSHMCSRANFAFKGTFLPSNRKRVSFLLHSFRNKVFIFIFLSYYVLSPWYQYFIVILTLWF